MDKNCDDFIITTQDLTKCYVKDVRAVNELNLNIPPNCIYTFVGPNGAGKTTTLRMLATQLLPTSGTVSIKGFDLIKEVYAIREFIASVPQEAYAYPELTAWDHVYYFLLARGMTFREAKKRAEQSLKDMGLWDIRKKLTAKLSGGLRHRVLITMAVSTQASILFLDEPTAGLDPIARREFWNIIVNLKEKTTIILTTHLMEEAESLSDQVMIINNGLLVARGTPEELKKSLAPVDKIIIDADGKCDRNVFTEFGRISDYAGKLQVYPESKDKLSGLLSRLVEKELSFSVKPTTLDDVFIKIVEGANEKNN